MKLILCYLFIFFPGLNALVSADVIQIQLPDNEVWVGDIGYTIEATYKTRVGKDKEEEITGIILRSGIDYFIINKKFLFFEQVLKIQTLKKPEYIDNQTNLKTEIHEDMDDPLQPVVKQKTSRAPSSVKEEGFIVIDLTGDVEYWPSYKGIHTEELIVPNLSNYRNNSLQAILDFNDFDPIVFTENYICEEVIELVLKRYLDAEEVTDIVFIITSNGGSADEIEKIATLLTDSVYSNRFTFHCVIKENAWSAAMLFAYACKNIFIFPGSAGGACVGYTPATNTLPIEVDAKFNSASAATWGRFAELNGHNALVPAAMIVMGKELFSWEDDAEKLVISDQVSTEFEYHLPLSDPNRKHYKTWVEEDEILSLTAVQMEELKIARIIETVDDIGPLLGRDTWNHLAKETKRSNYIRTKRHKKLQRAFIRELDYGEYVLVTLFDVIVTLDKMPSYMNAANEEYPSNYGGYVMSRGYYNNVFYEGFTAQAKRLWNRRLNNAIEVWENIYQYNYNLSSNIKYLARLWNRKILSEEARTPFQAQLREKRELLLDILYANILEKYGSVQTNTLKADTKLRQLKSQFKY